MTIDPILIDVPVHLRTARLDIVLPRVGTGADNAAAIMETWDQMNEFTRLGGDKAKWAADKAEIDVRQSIANFIERKKLIYQIFARDDGRFLGGIGLHPTWGVPSFTLNYWLRTSAHGHGYMTEAAAAIVHMTFAHLNAVRVEVDHLAHNDQSKKVIKRLGFMFEGVVPCSVKNAKDELYDRWRYHRLNADGLEQNYEIIM